MKADKNRAQILGENLKRIRLQKNISRKELAEKIAITETAYGKYERGESLPSLDKIFVLAEMLDISIIDLTGENPTAEANKNFVYRFNHAYTLSTAAGYNPKEFDGGILISVPKEVQHKENDGTIEVFPCVSTFKIPSKENFVDIVENAEMLAVRMDITFSEAFNLTFDK